MEAVRREGSRRRRSCRRRGEGGHLLLVLMVGITVMLIMLTVAAQSWTFRMKREMEAELIFRGEQYVTGLQIWRDKTGGFPVGDLEVLVKKGPDRVRTMRRLYENPFGKEGKWHYLFLHPNGSGYINPCANTGSDAFAAQQELVGQIPVSGMSLNGQGAGSPVLSGGTQPATGLPGQRQGGRMGKAGGRGGLFGDLGGMNPELFEKTVKAMNLAIVGVVNCTQEASIRTYQGQAWLANWAFTPLSQGEFGGNARPGHLTGGRVNIPSGLGMTGAQVYKDVKGLKDHGGGLMSGRSDPDKRPSRGVLGDSRGRAARGEGEEYTDEDERYDYQWRREQEDEAEEEEDDWRLRSWRRNPGQPDEGSSGDEDDEQGAGEDGDEEGEGEEGEGGGDEGEGEEGEGEAGDGEEGDDGDAEGGDEGDGEGDDGEGDDEGDEDADDGDGDGGDDEGEDDSP